MLVVLNVKDETAWIKQWRQETGMKTKWNSDKEHTPGWTLL